MVCCATTVIKLLLGIFNFCFLVLGGVITYVGFLLKQWDKQNEGALNLANFDFKSLPIIILALGIILVLISFFGFFGACCENSFMLNAYGFLMVAMIGCQIFTLVYSINHKTNFKTKIEDGIKKAITDIHDNDKMKKFLDNLQCSLKCCGWNGPEDYTKGLPSSCYGLCTDDKQKKRYDSFSNGCMTALNINKLNTLFGTSIGVSIAIILFELIIIFAACCLAREY